MNIDNLIFYVFWILDKKKKMRISKIIINDFFKNIKYYIFI